MHSQVCPPQSCSPGDSTAQFWLSVDLASNSNRRAMMAASSSAVGATTTMSSPGPTPFTPLSHRNSPTAHSAPVSPAPPFPPPLPSHPPTRQQSHQSQSIMHFSHQPSNVVLNAVRAMTPDFRNHTSPQTFQHESPPGSGLSQGSRPLSGQSANPPPPSLPPRRNPPPPPPRSGSGLYSPPPLPSQQKPSHQQHHRNHQCLSPDNRRYATSVVDTSQCPAQLQRALVQHPEAVSDCVDLEVTNGLLRLLFLRFANTAGSSVSTEAGGINPESGVPDLRRIVANLVRIAHTEIYIQPPSLQASHRCLEASVGPHGGLLEKMEASMYNQAPPVPGVYSPAGKALSIDANAVTPVRNPEKRGSRGGETASISSSSSASSDSASSDDDEDELDIEGVDYDIYEKDETSRGAGAPSPTAAPFSPPKATSATPVSIVSTLQPTGSTTLLTVAELHTLPQNTTIKCLKASAMQALITLVSAYHLDPALRQRDLDIAQLLARIQLYTMTQSERVAAIRSVACAGAEGRLSPDDGKRVAPTHVPVPEVAAIVRLSFHPNHRQAICDLGGLHALLSLLRWEHTWWQLQDESGHANRFINPNTPSQVHSTTPPTGAGMVAAPLDQSASPTVGAVRDCLESSLALRRYICVSLTNLTFGVPSNKSFVCKRRSYLEALIAQLEVGNEELKQVAASVLRNLSWHTDARSKAALRKAQAVTRLTRAVLSAKREATLRTTLNALWNLSSHSTANRKAVCNVEGALAFLISALDAKNPNKDVEIKANSGGVLRNLCPVIVNSLEYRAALRTHNCLSILLEQLRTSPSVTVVVNVCEVLGALSAIPLRDAKPSSALVFESASTDQALMIRLGALDILHRLSHSRHRYVVSSSKQALENLERAHILMKNQRVVPYPANSEASVFNPSTTTNGSTISNQSSPVSTPSSSSAEQVYRRRMNNRSHLRFGLLSVVLETNDDFEEEEETEDEDSCSVDDDEEGADEIDSVPEEERSTECSSKVSEAGGEEEVEFKLPDYPSTPDDHHVDLSVEKPLTPPPPPAYAQISVDEEEQACVYAEEGTPFGPSAQASTLDLRLPPKQQSSSVAYDEFISSQCRSIHPYVNVDMPTKGPSSKQASSGVSSPGFEASSNGVVLETPLMFSRATSSCISSVDFGPLPPIESSPESVYSDALDDDDGDPNEAIALGTSPSDLPPSLINDVKKPKRLNNDEKMGVVEEETQIMFAEEGSPLDSDSLSGDRESVAAAPSIWSVPEPVANSLQSSHNILQQCIASVMPPASSATQQTIGYPGDDVGASAALTEDTIQSFAVEGTPFAFSTKNSSLSDVSITDPEGSCGGTSTSSELSKSASPRQSMLKDGVYACSTGDASSVNEAEEEGSVNLLSEVIRSALPRQGGFSSTRGQTGVAYSDNSIEDVPVSDRSKSLGDSKLVTPRIRFGNPTQQRRPQATVAPMPQRSSEEQQTISTNEASKSEGKQSSASDGENSSFSSLLSIESVGIETSLLQECISSAMPTPKLPTSSSSRVIGDAKITRPSQQPIGYSLPAPSATAPLITPISSHSSQSSSPLAMSDITTNPKNRQKLQQKSILPQPRRHQTASPNGSSGLRRTGHFLAHGSGTAGAHTSRPEAIQIKVDLSTNATRTMRQSNPEVVVRPASAHTSTAGPALGAPRLTSGIVSRGNTKTAPLATAASVVDKKGSDDEFFPLPPPSANYDLDDDSVTLVGESSPIWRPSPPSTPPPQNNIENQNDELVDLDAMMNQSDDSPDLLGGTPRSTETPSAIGPTNTLAIKPLTVEVVSSVQRQLASRLPTRTTGLRKPTTVLPSRLASITSSPTSSISSSTSVSPQLRPGVRAQSVTLSPSSIDSVLPRASKLHSTSSLSRLTAPPARKHLVEGKRSTVATRSSAIKARGFASPLRGASMPAGTGAVATLDAGSGRTTRSAALSDCEASQNHSVTMTTPAGVSTTKNDKKVIRTGPRCEALVEAKLQQRLKEKEKGVRGGRKIPASAVLKSRVTETPAVNPSPDPTQTSVARPNSAINSSRCPNQTSLPSPTPAFFAMSNLKSPCSSLSGLRSPRAHISGQAALSPPLKTAALMTTSPSPSSLNAAEQWIVRRELTS